MKPKTRVSLKKCVNYKKFYYFDSYEYLNHIFY